MINFNFTALGRRPSASQILASWKRAGRPKEFSVTYGETEAEFRHTSSGSHWLAPIGVSGWQATGNGCRGVDRDAVVKLLNAQSLER